MILRRKFNGAKLYTEAWDVQLFFMFFRKGTGDFMTRSVIKLDPRINWEGRCEEQLYMVGERCMRDEVAAEAAVECIEVRMPE